jgi:pilus assembly protein CpaE
MSNKPDARINTLSIAIVVPDARRRQSLSDVLSGSRPNAVREFTSYPAGNDLTEILKSNCDVVIVDLDGDIEQAVRVIENICSRNAATTVMAYSGKNDANLMRRAMQAGAREFLTEPVLSETVDEALTRTAARHPKKENATGKTLAFIPAKGGIGVTTLASNFALALTKESGKKVVVVDLDFELGEVALGLGMTATYSVVDALLNPERLDAEFLSTLLLRHSSGLAVLAAAEDYNFFHAPTSGAEKLFQILRQEFDYVVVDSGSCHSHIQESLFNVTDTLYLVTELSFPALRNAHRVISFLSKRDGSRGVEVLLNRFNSRHVEIDENSATKAMGRPINWRIPNGYAAARAAQDSGIPLAMTDSPITRALTQMARAACGKPFTAEKKASTGFSFFGTKTLSEATET